MANKETKDQDTAVKYVGEGTYHGVDQGAGNKGITVAKGQSVFVSAVKAKQLNEDFPDQWDEVSAKEVAKSEKTAAAEAPAAAPAAAAPAEAPKKKGRGKR